MCKGLNKYVYIFYNINFHFIQEGLTGQSLKNISKQYLKDLKIPLPSKTVQQKIIDEIEILEKKEDQATASIINLQNNIKKLYDLPDKPSKFATVIMQSQYGFTDKANHLGSVRYLRITDLSNNGTIKSNGAVFINPSLETIDKFVLKDNDIVIARSGSVGKSAIYKISQYEKMIFASYLVRLKVDRRKILPQFLFNFTKTQFYWEQVDKLSIKGNQPNLNAEKIKEIKMPLPSLAEQQKIVKQIEKIEVKISKLEAQIKLISEQKAAILKKYL